MDASLRASCVQHCIPTIESSRCILHFVHLEYLSWPLWWFLWCRRSPPPSSSSLLLNGNLLRNGHLVSPCEGLCFRSSMNGSRGIGIKTPMSSASSATSGKLGRALALEVLIIMYIITSYVNGYQHVGDGQAVVTGSSNVEQLGTTTNSSMLAPDSSLATRSSSVRPAARILLYACTPYSNTRPPMLEVAKRSTVLLSKWRPSVEYRVHTALCIGTIKMGS